MTYKRTTTLQLRVVETIEVSADDNDDPRPSFRAPAAEVVTTDGEPVNDWRPLAKVKAPTRARRVG